MQGLDLGGDGDGQLVLSRDGEGSVAVAELAQDVDLGHVVPYGLHQLQVGRLHTLSTRTHKSAFMTMFSLQHHSFCWQRTQHTLIIS